MTDHQAVTRHYTHGGLLTAFEAALEASGRTIANVTIDDLAPADEFHVGGRRASAHLINQLDIAPESHVLDVGCGIGGTARFTADRFRCRVSGLDLTPEYVETGNALCGWVGLNRRIDLHQGSALDMPFPPDSHDGGYMMHVGMNIAEKSDLFAEIHRVLKPGSLFGVYDVMRTGGGDLTYPLPWASDADFSFVETLEVYESALADAGFDVVNVRERGEFALEFFKELRAAAAASGPQPLGLHIVLGETAAVKIKNLVGNITAGHIAPVEMIAKKRI